MAPLISTKRHVTMELYVKYLTRAVYVGGLVLFGAKIVASQWESAALTSVIMMLLTVFIIDDERTGLGT